ncbi:glycosyltransferase family 2 protein [Bdellovibrio bacteriovorus]|uniref:glycosyltransferase family 2 protein n=1 Tax=Bdellovibrio bacteriovorus TaxID=959 RepID=UPI0035A6B2D6
MNTELVSIVTPAYNAQAFISATIDSVLAQTYSNWEHLIVIDCNSKDRTEEIVQEYARKDPRVKCIKSPLAKGAAANRNTALAMAKGTFIAFVDADDLWVPQKLEKQLAFMEKNNYDFTYTAFTRISEDGSSLGMTLPAKKREL